MERVVHYSNFLTLGFLSACLAFAVEGLAANNITALNVSAIKSAKSDANPGQQVLIAKKRGKRRGSKRAGTRERNIIREKTYRGEKRKLDFEAVDIRGERDNPLGTQLGQTKANKEFDLIKIRLRWHPEMIQSTSSLETGGAR